MNPLQQCKRLVQNNTSTPHVLAKRALARSNITASQLPAYQLILVVQVDGDLRNSDRMDAKHHQTPYLLLPAKIQDSTSPHLAPWQQIKLFHARSALYLLIHKHRDTD
jgi:hypothetical protein